MFNKTEEENKIKSKSLWVANLCSDRVKPAKKKCLHINI